MVVVAIANAVNQKEKVVAIKKVVSLKEKVSLIENVMKQKEKVVAIQDAANQKERAIVNVNLRCFQVFFYFKKLISFFLSSFGPFT